MLRRGPLDVTTAIDYVLQASHAVVAGHVIECGTQATGGNYSFFSEVPGITKLGFPIAELREDGSSVITKHPGSGGLVSVGTVTAQLLYEIQGRRYINPDVVTRFDSIQLSSEGSDRVLVSGVRGEPASDTLKVSINYIGGYRNTMTFVITGLDVEAKAEIARRQLFDSLGGEAAFEHVDVQLVQNAEAIAQLRVTVKDRDAKKVGRAFSNRFIELALSSYPGFFTTTPPEAETTYGVYWPALVPAGLVAQTVVLEDGRRLGVGEPPRRPWVEEGVDDSHASIPDLGPTRRLPLGAVFGARSGGVPDRRPAEGAVAGRCGAEDKSLRAAQNPVSELRRDRTPRRRGRVVNSHRSSGQRPWRVPALTNR